MVDGRGRDGGWLADSAARCRELAARLGRDGDHQQLAMALGWAAEAYEDHQLARRFERALPEDLVVELLAPQEPPERSHRLLVTSSRSFTCAACTNEYTGTAAVRVDDTEDITFCPHCIGIAALAVAPPPEDAFLPLGVLCPASTASERELATVQKAPVRVMAAAALVVAALITSTSLTSAGLLPAGLEDVVHRMLTPFGMDAPALSEQSDQPPANAPDSPMADASPQIAEARNSPATEQQAVIVDGQRATVPGGHGGAETGGSAAAPPPSGSRGAEPPSSESPPEAAPVSAEQSLPPADVISAAPEPQPSTAPQSPSLAMSAPVDAPLSPPVTDVRAPEVSLDEPPPSPETGAHAPKII